MLAAMAIRLAALLDQGLLWRVPDAGNRVFLTFDDGPHPEITPWVLDTLAAYDAKATFFCLGERAAAHPALMGRIRGEGHAVGHHSWDHPDGWHVPGPAYRQNVLRGAEHVGGNLFRPPYGRLTPGMLGWLKRRYRVVLWDVMGGDFKPGRTGAECARHVLGRSGAGSIIVLHDNGKSRACLQDALGPILEGLHRQGFRCASLADVPIARPPR